MFPKISNSRNAKRQAHREMGMTENQKQRIAQAASQYVRLLTKEKAYRPHLRNNARIAEYEGRLADLWALAKAA